MLHANSHAVLLNFLNIRHYHYAGKTRILAHILKIASVQRSSVDVYARTEQHVFFAVARFFSYGLAVEGRHFLAPGGCKASQRRKCHTGIIGPSGLLPLVPKHFRANAVRAVGAPKLRNPKTGHSGR